MNISSVEYPTEPGAIDLRELKKHLKKDNPLILEVGANTGQSTSEFLQVFPNPRIFCFEPEPRAIEIFKRNIHSPAVTLHEIAIGSYNGDITFNQSSGKNGYENWNQSGSIRTPKQHTKIWPDVTFQTQIEVPIMRLDDWAAQNQIEGADFIWADVQGAEGDLIIGAKNLLSYTKFFYTEYGFSELYEGQLSLDQVCEALFDSGHVLWRKFGMDALFVNRNLVDLNEINFPIKRQSSCPCGSGKLYEKCHG